MRRWHSGLKKEQRTVHSTGTAMPAALSRIVVDLDSNEMLANNARDILIRIGFLIHDMTPMTRDCLEIEQHKFFLSRRSIEYVGRPWLPVDQIWMSARRLCCR